MSTQTYYSAVQCTDATSGQTGCFIHAGDRVAISPVLPDLMRLYAWMRASGWESIPNGVWTVRRIGDAS